MASKRPEVKMPPVLANPQKPIRTGTIFQPFALHHSGHYSVCMLTHMAMLMHPGGLHLFYRLHLRDLCRLDYLVCLPQPTQHTGLKKAVPGDCYGITDVCSAFVYFAIHIAVSKIHCRPCHLQGHATVQCL